MQTALSLIMRDYLIRFQQTAIKETGRRPLTYLREPMDEKLVLPGCQRPGYAFWQPCPGRTGLCRLAQRPSSFTQALWNTCPCASFWRFVFICPWRI